MFLPVWPYLPGPGCQPNKLFLAQVFFGIYTIIHLEPLIGLLAYLEPEL